MRIHYICLSILTWLILGASHRGTAQLLTNRSFDFVLQGDDPGVVFTFNLPGDPLAPVGIHFGGLFQNLDPFETGVRYDLSWTGAGGGEVVGSMGIDFTRLPGAGQWPVNLDQTLGFTPATVFLHVEGGGPGDHFRFVGDLAIQAVPEPGLSTLLGGGAILVVGWSRLTRAKSLAAGKASRASS